MRRMTDDLAKRIDRAVDEALDRVERGCADAAGCDPLAFRMTAAAHIAARLLASVAAAKDGYSFVLDATPLLGAQIGATAIEYLRERKAKQ